MSIVSNVVFDCMEGLTFATNNCCSVVVSMAFCFVVSMTLYSIAFVIPIAQIYCLFRFLTVFGSITDKIVYPVVFVSNISVVFNFLLSLFFILHGTLLLPLILDKSSIQPSTHIKESKFKLKLIAL